MKPRTFEKYCRICLPLLKSGLPVSRTPQIIGKMDTVSPDVRTFARYCLYMMQTGCSFTYTVERYFPSLKYDGSIALFTVFEKTGTVEQAMELYLSRKDEEHRLQRKMFSALLYPALVLMGLCVLCLFLATNSALFGMQDYGKSVTHALVKGGAFFVCWMTAVFLWLTQVFRENQKEQFYHVMAVGLRAGHDLVTCLRLCALHQTRLTAPVSRVIRLIEQGIPLAIAMRKQKVFSRDDVSLIEVALDNQDMARGFAQNADRLQQQNRSKQDRSITLIEPVLLTGVGAVILMVSYTAIIPYLTSFGGIA